MHIGLGFYVLKPYDNPKYGLVSTANFQMVTVKTNTWNEHMEQTPTLFSRGFDDNPFCLI